MENELAALNMQLLFCSSKRYKLRVDMKLASGRTVYAEYGRFWIDSEIFNYRLHVENYSGTAGKVISKMIFRGFYLYG